MLSAAAALAVPALSLGAPAAGRAGDPGAVPHGLYWLAANLAADQPLLLAIDDAHWADLESVAFLSYLARRIEGHASLVVLATRSGEGVSELLPSTAHPDHVLRPRALSEEATVALVDGTLGGGSPEFARACHTASGGNPFLVKELLSSLREEGVAPDREGCARVARIAPRAISRATLARVRRLGDAATRLTAAIAVLGRSAEPRHAAELAHLELEVAGEVAADLVRASILRDARPLEFVHPLVRTSIYGQVPAIQRAVMHKQAAGILARDGAEPDAVASHLVEAESASDPDVVRCLRAAAHAARARGAPQAACGYLVRALEEPPRPQDRADVLYELGSAEVALGDPRAHGHLRAALEGDLEPSVRLAAALDFVATLVFSDRVDECMTLLDGLIDQFAARGEVEAAMQLEGILACAGQLSPATFERTRERLARYAGRLRGETPGGRLLLAALAWDAVHRPVPAAHAADLAERALGGGRLLYESYWQGANFALATLTLLVADRLELAERMSMLAVDYALEHGSLIGFAGATALRSQTLMRQGRLADAEAEARSCLDAAGHVWPLGRPMLIACVLEPMLERADLADCQAFLVEQGVDERGGAWLDRAPAAVQPRPPAPRVRRCRGSAARLRAARNGAGRPAVACVRRTGPVAARRSRAGPGAVRRGARARADVGHAERFVLRPAHLGAGARR